MFQKIHKRVSKKSLKFEFSIENQFKLVFLTNLIKDRDIYDSKKSIVSAVYLLAHMINVCN